MAKGDDARSRNRIDASGGRAQNLMENLRTDTIVPQNQTFWNNYLRTFDRGVEDYNDITRRFQDFSDTGGYSRNDLANIRSRAISPIRSVYANANREVDRQRALQGGYSPNYTAAKAKMAREASSATADATTNAEAAIAEMVNQGKRFGTSGLLSAYGTEPGLASLAQQGALTSTGQQLDLAQLENQLQLGLIGSQISASQLPGKWEHTMGRVGDIAKIGSGVIYPWLPTGGAA